MSESASKNHGIDDDPLELGKPDSLKNVHISFHCQRCKALESKLALVEEENEGFRESLSERLLDLKSIQAQRDKFREALEKIPCTCLIISKALGITLADFPQNHHHACTYLIAKRALFDGKAGV